MATSITTIQATDLITNSRADINNNFDSILVNKIETDVLDTDTALTADSDAKVATQKAVKAYVDAGGNVNASTTGKGIVEEATDAEALAGTATGGTGARLFVNPGNITALKPVTRTYNYADSPATWTKPTGLHSLRVQVWGGGGSGSYAIGSNEGGGGGGGGYLDAIFLASALGDTETVTIGAGGASKVIEGTGLAGGNTTFGSLLTGYAGGGATLSGSGADGGGGGGALGAGSSTGAAGSIFGGAGGTTTTSTAVDAFLGAGGGGVTSTTGGNGGNSFYGGGGGGGAGSTAAGAGGTSKFGGAGGAGSISVAATAGSVPGGGGGAGHGTTHYSGAGGNGRCIVTEYYV